MSILLNLLIIFITFFIMEFVAWFTHKYIMHGFLWFLHEDHHNQPKTFFQKNDSFFLIFALPGWLFMMFGIIYQFDFRFYIGIGVLIYGLAYFLVHEVIIHRRFPKLRKIVISILGENSYLRNLTRAHHVHHSVLQKEGASTFGMLIVPKSSYKGK